MLRHTLSLSVFKCVYFNPKGEKMIRYIIAMFTLLTVMVSNAYAIPAFARQMGVSCSACHSENGYPTLNRFGRDFKASGYTMLGSEKTVGGSNQSSDGLASIPSALNMSVVGGSSINSGSGSNGTTVATNNFGIFLGGRISENVGAFVEVGYTQGTAVTDTNQSDHFSLANFVVPITYKIGDNTFGLVPYTTDGHSATASEFFDNGGFSAISKVGARDKYGAKGLSLYIYNPNYFINYVAWSNGNRSGSEVKLANYFRAAYTPQIGNWDLEFGTQYMTGNTNNADANGFIIPNSLKKTDAYVLDFNALGAVANLPLDVAISYARAKYDANSLFTTNSDGQDGKAFVFDTKLGIIPRTLIARLYYVSQDHVDLNSNPNDKVNTTELGLKYFIAENVNVETTYDFISGNSVSANNDNVYGLNFEVAF